MINPKKKTICNIIIWAMLINLIVVPGRSPAGPTIPGFHGSVTSNIIPPAPNTLPSLRNIIQGAEVSTSGNRMRVGQNMPKAVMEWDSFDIGKSAEVHFDQKGHADWAALNRIFDQNPSRIFGKLTGDGKIFLINQNGILFGRNSSVNVHSLVASSLNINNEDFINGILDLKGEDYISGISGAEFNQDSFVINQGTLTTDETGSIFLLAPRVENSGIISTPLGQTGLAAGEKVELAIPENTTDRSDLTVKIKQNPGTVINLEQGAIVADSGTVGMYGRVVNQEGLIRAVTAVKKNGKIELLASDRVVTGKKSITICPVSESSEKVHNSFEQKPGIIKIGGLDSENPVRMIEHNGILCAPSGNISLTAQERIYLEDGSLIDVNGMWVNMSQDANRVEAQLNSVELRDDYGQKDGFLKGETIIANAVSGSAIGDISGHLDSDETSALEKNVSGGKISLNVISGDIIFKKGAKIDFSGGGIYYGKGYFNTTKLFSGNRMYDISEAPQWLHYDGILNFQQKNHIRYGISEQFEGLFYGGANPLMEYSSDYIDSADAGQLIMISKNILFDGILKGTSEPGFYQTEASEPEDEFGNKIKKGFKQPKSGTLIFGDANATIAVVPDFVLEDVIVTAASPPAQTGFAPDSAPLEGPTLLGADKLADSGLSSIEIYANLSFKTEKNAFISLVPGNSAEGWKDENGYDIGRFTATARSIEHKGEINIPAGTVSLTIMNNKTSQGEAGYIPLNERIYLEDGSTIFAGGEKIDNTFKAQGSGGRIETGHINGGKISLIDRTSFGDGVILKEGAVLDVSGGYEINGKNGIKGGDAGTVTMQGSSLIVAGKLNGYSLPGNNGGRIILHAENVDVFPSVPVFPGNFNFTTPLPAGFSKRLILSSSRFDNTGFTEIDIRSVYDLNFNPGSALAPSHIKQAAPQAGGKRDSSQINNFYTAGEFGQFTADGDALINIPSCYTGQSSVSLSAGLDFQGRSTADNMYAGLKVAPGTLISVAPGGEINLSAPCTEFAGIVNAPSGKVKLKSTELDLILKTGSRIMAAGFNMPDAKSAIKRLPAGFSVLPGGEVILEAGEAGSLILESGTIVDVSGSTPFISFIISQNGNISQIQEAGDPGSIRLASGNEMILEGELKGHALMDGLKGGAITIAKKNEIKGLTISPEVIGRYKKDGFDAIGFESWKEINFSGPMDISLARKLTLDAPVIKGSGNDQIRFSAPWVRLCNTYWPASIGEEPAVGEGSFTLTGDWVDVEGNLLMDGFKQINLEAVHDIRFSDVYYTKPYTTPVWGGEIKTGGDLTIQGAGVYPTTLSDYRITVGGKVLTLPSALKGNSSKIISAGGKIEIRAKEIEHTGFLAAPMGKIALYGIGDDSRVYLADGSVVSIKGEAPVKYGDLGEIFWTLKDKQNINNDDGIPVSEGPEKSLEIKVIENPGGGGEIIVRKGALLDVSGGGSVFSYSFMPGIKGSENPLTKKGNFVIMPDNSVKLPGKAVYLEGAEGLAPGFYSLLPEEYAFLPGAMVITDLGVQTIPGSYERTKEGYRVVQGYTTVMGTDIKSPKKCGYAVRPAVDVFKEGQFNYAVINSGNAGDILIKAPTSILDGNIAARALSGYTGGIFEISAAQNAIVRVVTALPDDFGFKDRLSEDFIGKSMVSSEGLSGKGFKEIKIGSTDTTSTILLEDNSRLEAQIVTLAAADSISIAPGSLIEAMGIEAMGEKGAVNFISPDGKLIIEKDALVHASHEINLDTPDFSIKGEMKVDNSKLNIIGNNIFIVPDNYTGPHEDGFYLSESLQGLTGFESIGFLSRGIFTLLDSVDFEIPEELTIDAGIIAGMITGLEDNGEGLSHIRAGTINLLNTQDEYVGNSFDDLCQVTFEGEEINIGHGDLLMDGFSSVNFNSAGEIFFRGQGSFKTDADLNLAAAGISGTFYADKKSAYEACDFIINAPGKKIITDSNGAVHKANNIPGGILDFNARSIEHNGIIDLPSGRIILNATGKAADGDEIFLNAGSAIFAKGCDTKGYDKGPGGIVVLKTEEGQLRFESGALIDVSAGSQGDAGAVEIYAPEDSSPVLDGELAGSAGSGKGGSLFLDTGFTNNFSSLVAKLDQGGFNKSIGLRFHSGDLEILEDDTVFAHQFRLAADRGSIYLSGSIDVCGDEPGRVELFAGQDLVLYDGSIIKAGGEVYLSAAAGNLDFRAGALIDVAGGENGQAGRVGFRAGRIDTNNDGADNDIMMDLNGTIVGAERVTAEGVKIYEDNFISSRDMTQWRNETSDFITQNGTAIRERLLEGLNIAGMPESGFYFLPGLEIRSPEDLTLAAEWDLTSWRFNENPGVLTLRAAGNLEIEQNLMDHPTSIYDLQANPELDSWGINLVAGADPESADFMAVNLFPGEDSGNLVVQNNRLIYTESAPVNFAAGGDVLIGSGKKSSYMLNSFLNYSLGTFDGTIRGSAGRDFIIEQKGAVQSATGDLEIKAGRDIILNGSSAVRTTGFLEMSEEELSSWLKYILINNYSEYAGGGDILLVAARGIKGSDYGGWDAKYNILDYGDPDDYSDDIYEDKWSASYTNNVTSGFAAMGGGNVTISSGDGFSGWVGVFGKGNLAIQSGGDIDGRFLVKEGSGNITGMGNFGLSSGIGMENQAIELFDAKIDLAVQGSLALGACLNPTIAHADFIGEALQYTEDTALKLTARQGDVTISGLSRHYGQTSNTEYQHIMPPNLEIEAGKNIYFKNRFVLAPSSTGSLSLKAGLDINGLYTSAGKEKASQILLSDLSPADVYQDWPYQYIRTLTDFRGHGASPVHADDPFAAVIHAGRDIKNFRFILSKQADIAAGRDILDIYCVGQNINETDLTQITAKRNIFFSTAKNAYQTGIEYGGPGYLLVQAGNRIDLGTTQGIQSVGNLFNPALNSKGSSVIVVSGSDAEVTPDNVNSFFDRLREAGKEFSTFLAGGKTALAKERVANARTEIIDEFFKDSASGEGHIDMVRSRIMTAGEESGIYILAKGDLNVGKSSFGDKGENVNTGITTESGGPVNIFSYGDVNVLESRVMTMMGGDITIWSDKGDINAGRGSRTAVSRGKPMIKTDPDGTRRVIIKPVALGSGIRTATYDPDGLEGPAGAPEAGHAFLFAPDGIIDAGEAGIAANNVILGAPKIVNTQNIKVSGASVGVPATSKGTAGLGALTGAGGLTETNRLTDSIAGLGASPDKYVSNAESKVADYSPVWLKVKVIGFEGI